MSAKANYFKLGLFVTAAIAAGDYVLPLGPGHYIVTRTRIHEGAQSLRV